MTDIETLGGGRITVEPESDETQGWDIRIWGVNVRPADLAKALNNIVPGFTATYAEPEPPLPTEPGLYVAANMRTTLQSATVFRLFQSGKWTSPGHGFPDTEATVRQVNATAGLVRLVPEAVSR